MNRLSLAFLALSLLTGGVWLAAGPTSQPTTTSAPARFDVPRYIQIIRTTDDAQIAMAAYAKACAIDRTNTELQRTYLRRMLRFGKPRIALFPARAILTRGSDGLAWGVVAYVEAQRRNLDKSLSASILAAETVTDNPSICSNLGQLLAWYDHQKPPPALSKPAVSALAAVRAKLQTVDAFAEAYRATDAEFAAREAIEAKHQDGIDAAKAEAEELYATGKGIDDELSVLNERIRTRRNQVNTLQAELAKLEEEPETDPSGRRRKQLRQEIDDLSDEIRTIKSEAATVRRRGQQVLVQLKRKLAEVKKLQYQMKRAVEKIKIAFDWRPPAVDGVVTPEANRLSPTTSSPSPLAPSYEQVAADRLKVARLYIKNGLTLRARGILMEVISKYPRTAAAGEARKVLNSLTEAPDKPKRPATRSSS